VNTPLLAGERWERGDVNTPLLAGERWGEGTGTQRPRAYTQVLASAGRACTVLPISPVPTRPGGPTRPGTLRPISRACACVAVVLSLSRESGLTNIAIGMAWLGPLKRAVTYRTGTWERNVMG